MPLPESKQSASRVFLNSPNVPGDTRERILAASVVCVGRDGFAGTSLDAVAALAKVGRATVYRYFPGGRDELFDATIEWEVARFFRRLAIEVENVGDLAARLEFGLPFARNELAHHEVFQKVFATEPERLLPHLSTSVPLMIEALQAYLTPLLASEKLVDGVDVDDSAEYLARMILTFIMGEGSWDLRQPDQVRELVRGQLLAGIVANS